MKFLDHRFAVVVLVLVALLLRVAFLFLAGVDAPLTGDELAYQQIAENVAAGRGFYQDNNPFFPGQILYAWQAPLYPLSLAALYRLVGPNLLFAKLVGVLFSTATVYLVYDLARVIFRSKREQDGESKANDRTGHRIALAAAFLVAIYPGLLTQAHLLLSETLFIFLLILAFTLAGHGLERDKERVLWLVGAGAAWGLATLTRGITFYFTPLFALWVGWMLWHGNAGVARAVWSGILILLAAAVCILPWSLRNYSQFGQVVLLETKGGVNLWLGNSPDTPANFIRNVWKVGVREPMLDVLPEDELERDRAAYALGIRYIRANPGTFFRRMPVKFADFWGFERNLPDIAEATTKGDGWKSISKIGADVFATVMAIVVILLGVFGLIFSPNDRWKVLLGGFTLYFLAVHLVIFGDGRFHLPLIPIIALYAGWLLVEFREIKYTTTQLVLAAVCMFLLLVVWMREMLVAFQILTAG